MILTPDALATLESAERELKLPVSERDTLARQINAASDMICKHCHRTFRRRIYTQILNANGGKIVLPIRPVYEITSLRYDTTRIFPPTFVGDTRTSTEIDPTTYVFNRDGIIDLDTALDVSDRTIRVVYDAGYSLIKYIQIEDPTDMEEGDCWINASGAVQVWDAAAVPDPAWVVYDTEPIPGNITQAAIEYTQVMRRKARPGEAGLATKEKLFADGASFGYEPIIPAHVLFLLADEVYYGI